MTKSYEEMCSIMESVEPSSIQSRGPLTCFAHEGRPYRAVYFNRKEHEGWIVKAYNDSNPLFISESDIPKFTSRAGIKGDENA